MRVLTSDAIINEEEDKCTYFAETTLTTNLTSAKTIFFVKLSI